MKAPQIEALREQITEDRASLRQGLQQATAAAGAADRELLRWVLSCDRAELWRQDGCRNSAQWVSGQLGVSNWKARRLIAASYPLEHLPHLSAALESGALSLDKTLELTRFATALDEKKLVRWARRVTMAAVRQRADETIKRQLEEVKASHDSRFFRSWKTDDDRVWLEGLLPAEQGAQLMAAVDRLAQELPEDPDEGATFPGLDDEDHGIEQRRADALVLLATSGGDGKASQATVVLHAPLEALAHDEGNCTLESGHVLHPETARMLSCDARLQVVLYGKDGNALGIGNTSQIAPRWLRRQVLKRDGHRCTFPGCEAKRFLVMHHIKHWTKRGPTDLYNLVTVCSFHHTVIHKSGWNVALEDGKAQWFRPLGRRYEPGRAPPEHPQETSRSDPHRLGQAAGFSRMFDLVKLL